MLSTHALVAVSRNTRVDLVAAWGFSSSPRVPRVTFLVFLNAMLATVVVREFKVGYSGCYDLQVRVLIFYVVAVGVSDWLKVTGAGQNCSVRKVLI